MPLAVTSLAVNPLAVRPFARTSFAAAALLSAALMTPNAHATEMATATIAGTQVSPGVFDYKLTLNDTGTTTIGTFWFSWIPGFGFLSATPTIIQSPTGWTYALTSGNSAIRWVATSPATYMNPGTSLSGFEFLSTEGPDQLNSSFTKGTATQPATISYIYVGAPLAAGDPGYSFAPSVTTVTPEPSALLLTLTGAGALFTSLRRRIR